MPGHKYIIKNVLFDDEEEWAGERRHKYERDGRLRMLEERTQELNEKKEQVLQSTLQSTKNSLAIIRDTECIGIDTSIQLNHQGEQLRKVNDQLDVINADLEQNQSRLGSIESVFHSLKNRITGKSKRHRKQKTAKDRRSSDEVQAKTCKTDEVHAKTCKTDEVHAKTRKTDEVHSKTGSSSFDSHPTARLYLKDNVDEKDAVEKEIEENLEEMVSHVARLKEIGLNIGNEIDQQNKMLDVIQLKVDNSDIKIKSQTQRINKILN